MCSVHPPCAWAPATEPRKEVGESLELGRIQRQNVLCEGLVLCSGLELGRWAECCTTLSPIPRSIKSELMGVGPPESLSLYVF